MRSPRSKLLALAAAPIILLSACSSDGGDDAAATSAPDNAAATSAGPDSASSTAAASTDIADVDVDVADEDGVSVPSLTLGGDTFADGAVPFSLEATETKEVDEGDGNTVEAGEEVTVKYLAVNGTTGEELLSTFPTEESVVMDTSSELLLPAFAETLVGQKAGSSYILGMPPADGFGEAGNANLGINPGDTVLFYVEVISSATPLSQAEGEEVEPKDGLPTVEADGTSPATITIPDDLDAPDELVVEQLIKGERAEVEAGQTVSVHYTGVKFSDGELFDSSLTSGTPFSTVIGAGQVIEGWDEGLVGQPVGSRVLMIIPPELAYGAADGDELQEETLVFVVDILSAS